MSRLRKALGIAVAAAPLAVLSLASLAAASDVSGQGTIRVTTKIVQLTHLDLGRTGLSQGDETVFSEDVFIGGARVGTTGGTCTVSRVLPGDREMQCIVTVSLPRGQLTIQGLTAASEKTSRLVITGGTGAYRDAGGYVSVPGTTGDLGATGTTVLVVDRLKK